MSNRRLKTLTALTAAALLLVIGVGGFVGSSTAASTLAPQIERALGTSGLEDVRVDVDGREVSVRQGTLGELTEAVGVAGQVSGVRSASIDSRPGSVDRIDTTRPYLRLRRDTGRLRILGAVPTAADAATVKSSAARAFGVPVRGDLQIDRSLPPAGWTGELPVALSELTRVADMRLTVDGRTLEVTGSIGTAVERDDVLRRLRLLMPSLRIAADITITPVVS